MSARVEFFFDLSSPWTCLAFHNLPGVLERTGATAPGVFRFYRPRCDRVVANVLARISGQSPSAA